MAFNGSGTYNTTNPPPFVADTIIEEGQMNAALADVAAALSLVLVRDGQAAMTGTLDMGTQSLINLAAGAAATPSLRFTTGNGFYRSGTDEISMALGGAQKVVLSTTTLTTFGVLNGYKSSQTTYATAGVVSTSATGDVHIGLHAAGDSACSLKHVRGGNGLTLVGTDGTTKADFACAALSSSTTFAAPAQPAAVVWSGSQHSSGSMTEMTTYSTTVLNRGSHMNASTGRFTAPVTGVYFVKFRARSTQSVASGGEASVRKNGSAVQGAPTAKAPSTITGIFDISDSDIMALTASDYISVFASVGDASNVIQLDEFSVALLY